ncbi:MAG: DUF58 domain-containing protein [Clostridiales bacterium]|nr:DUF58 domain-containing protein [Clostridiales bacterium]
MILYFAIFAAILALVLQRLLSGKSLDHLEETHFIDAALVEPDASFDIVISLTNKSRRILPFLRVRERIGEDMQLHLTDGTVLTDSSKRRTVTFSAWLRPRQALVHRISVSIPKRGRYYLLPLTVSAGDFLGLNETVRTTERFSEVVVMPRRAPQQRISEVLGGFLGDVSVRRFLFEDPVLTLGFREYTGREPMKSIAWTQTARSGSLMVKNYDHTMEPTVSVLLNADTRSEESAELIERCYSITRTVCEALEARKIKYAFRTNAIISGSRRGLTDTREGLGERHFYGILEGLGRATHDASSSLGGLIREALRPTGDSTNGYILITPERPKRYRKEIARLRERSGGRLLVISAEEVGVW